MKEVGLVLSTSEARRLIEQGAVAVDRIRVTAVDQSCRRETTPSRSGSGDSSGSSWKPVPDRT